MVDEYNKAAAIWVERLGVDPDLQGDLNAFVSASSHWTYHQMGDMLARFVGYGPRGTIPLLTTAPFVIGDVRDYVLDIIRQVGDDAAYGLIAILEQPLFEAYRQVWRKAKVADPGAANDAQHCSQYVYRLGIEGLKDIVRQCEGMPSWLAAARSTGIAYKTADDARLSSLARSVVEYVDIKVRVREAMDLPTDNVRDAGLHRTVEGTGWGQSQAEREQHLHERRRRGAQSRVGS